MQKQVTYKVYAQIINDLPNISIIINYRDDFTDDRYILKSEATVEKGSKEIVFNITKNGRDLGYITLLEGDFESFCQDFFKKIKDIDFKNEFYKNTISKIGQEVSDFLKYYNEAIVLNGVTLECEMKRMKNIAGISKK